jgi:hypothetical protein
MEGIGSTPPRAALFIGGSTESIRCGSFHRTIHLNGSILRSSQEDQGGFFANRLQLRPKSEFRSSAKQEDNIRSS